MVKRVAEERARAKRRGEIAGYLFGLVSVIVVLLVALVPIEDLVHIRPEFPSYTIDYTYLYLWRLSLLSLLTLLLTAVTGYVVGFRPIYRSCALVQSVFFIAAHWLYLAKLCLVSTVQVMPFVYVVNGVPHLDLAQVLLVVLVGYLLYSRFRKSRRIS